MSEQYFLMNKDSPLLSFTCSRNEYEEPIFSDTLPPPKEAGASCSTALLG